MQCPACKDSVLTMTERSGVEIDYCPKCRGVWLDRGELDKLVERGGAMHSAVEEGGRHVQRSGHSDSDDLEPREYNQKYGQQPKRKRSWLGEMFDM